jgi:nucleoside-diphosphate-sugar epimerase
MRVLVTGCAGFIGSTVAALLLGQGHEVVGLDNLNSAYDVRLKEWRLTQLQDKRNFLFHRLDIADRAAVQSVFSDLKPSDPTSPIIAIMNFAARAGVRQSVEDPWSYYQANVVGTLNLLEECKDHGIAKFIQASTSSVYGSRIRAGGISGPDSPHKLNEPFHEDDPTDCPLSPYAASKKAAEELCHSYHHLYGLNVTVFRFFTVYGPAGRPDMSVFRFIKWIDSGEPVTVFGDGLQERDFTYVEDIARGVISALELNGFDVINLGGDRPVQLREMIQLVENLLEKKANLSYSPADKTDVLATWADISKARQMLDWSPQTQLEDGLANTVKWYRENHLWAQHTTT